MNWNKDRSTGLSLFCVAFFALMLLMLDIFGLRIIRWWVDLRQMGGHEVVTLFTVSLAALSVFAWVCLWYLWKLLTNIRHGEVFIKQNVRSLRLVSWCCGAAALLCLASGLYYPPFFFAFAACAFMMLIVRIVKNCFQQACEMKEELDLTI